MDEQIPDDEVVARIREAIEWGDEREVRIQRFQDAVRDMPGQLGALMRQIGHAHAEFTAAERMGGTTEGESCRLGGVLEEAMATVDWLREGER